MTRLAATPALLALAFLAACNGNTAAEPPALAKTPAVHTGSPPAPAQAMAAGELMGTILETQQGALLHVHIRRSDGQEVTLVCDRQCFPKLELLQEGRQVRVQWQRQEVKWGDEVFDEDVITQVDTP